MRIVVSNKKGGVGKTPLSFSLAKDLGYYLLSNDDSVIETIYPGQAKIVENLKIIDDCVYDLGGFVTSGVIDIVKASDILIVPCFADIDALKRTIKTLEELEPLAKETIVIVTKTEREGDFEYVANPVKKHFPKVKIFELKKSRIFNNVMETGMSPIELANESAFTRYAYRGVISQYEKIFNFIKNKKGGAKK
jgi:cellulose biosynthesis protein BcsQ